MAAHGAACSRLLMAAAFLVAASFMASSSVGTADALAKANDVWGNAGSSWGLGVVLPNGTGLVNGNALSWADVRNVTSLVKLPNIAEPSGVIYLVLSAEGDNGAIFQVAAGIWPGSDGWSVYSWYITEANTNSPQYSWVANSSAPTMAPGDLVSMSISAAQDSWGMRVQDINTTVGRTVSVPSQGLLRFASGDQEVFAMESYTSTASTFREMGNASLLQVLADGSQVAGGWYAYGGWDPARSPLFAVGSSQPPPFVSLKMTGSGQAFWTYQAPWTGEVLGTSFHPVVLAYASLAAVVPIALVVGTRRRHGKEEKA